MRKVWRAMTSAPDIPLESVRTCPELVEGVSEVVGSGDEGRATALVHASAALVLGPTCPYPGDELFATTPFCICQLPTAALVRGPKLPVIAPVYPALSRRNSCNRDTSAPLMFSERVREMSTQVAPRAGSEYTTRKSKGTSKSTAGIHNRFIDFSCLVI